ncbi:MAG TPA: hypothetical protein VMR25_09070 [Planctomycetaceae bacterium]|jgi:hypothetical protein|nr:hypothetical protein [Planctomycetaceae bacterium]
MLRLFTLIFGPPVIVGFAFLVARPDVSRRIEPSANPSAAESPIASPTGPRVGAAAESTLVAECQRKREELMHRLGARFFSIVHTPFVIAGDLAAADLERHYRETIAPTARALAIAYFDRPPTRPISIVLLSGDEAYQSCVERLDGQRRPAFAGYYERSDRRIVINAETGEGTIAHELAHALGHFDFPDMPEWFDEGFASLHEEARFSDDHLRITGMPNWRSRYLLPALQKRTLRPLESLIAEARVRPNQQAVDYAHARYFCLFLQERGLLEPFYRKFRLAVPGDPSGLRTLHALFDVNDLAPIDDQFRAWALALEQTPATASKTGQAAESVQNGRKQTKENRRTGDP